MLVFREFEACRKLREVPRKLGVYRLKDLDVGKSSFDELQVSSEFRGISDVIL